MSGWWLFTDRYSGRREELTRAHAIEVAAARPDVAACLALPTGYRFDMRGRLRVWPPDEAGVAQAR